MSPPRTKYSSPCGAGDDEGVIEVLAGCQGVYARHCTPPELAALLKGGAFAPASASRSERLGHALTLAAVAQYAPERCDSSPG